MEIVITKQKKKGDEKVGEKRAEEESRRKHQAQLSGRAKDTVTRRTVMILVSDHTYTHTPPPPTEILSAFSLLCQPPPPAPCIISSSMSISSGTAAPEPGRLLFIALDPTKFFRSQLLQANSF